VVATAKGAYLFLSMKVTIRRSEYGTRALERARESFASYEELLEAAKHWKKSKAIESLARGLLQTDILFQRGKKMQFPHNFLRKEIEWLRTCPLLLLVLLSGSLTMRARRSKR